MTQPAFACPPCPECGAAAGVVSDSVLLTCATCGHAWAPDAAALTQARAADAAWDALADALPTPASTDHVRIQ